MGSTTPEEIVVMPKPGKAGPKKTAENVSETFSRKRGQVHLSREADGRSLGLMLAALCVRDWICARNERKKVSGTISGKQGSEDYLRQS